MTIRSVLFVGRRNAARSLMAETCFNAASIHGWRAFSAGWQTELEVDRNAVRALRARGFPTDALSSKPVSIFRQAGAPVIDLCVFMDVELPADVSDYPALREHWHVADPHGAPDVKAAYDGALDEIMRKISGMILTGRLAAYRVPLAIAS